MKVLAVASFLTLLAGTAAGAPGDPRVVQGTLVWSPGAAGDPFVVVRADDGKHYVADLATAQRRGAIDVGDRISVAGVEGARPFEVVTVVIGAGDSARSAFPPAASTPSTAAPGPDVGPGPPPTERGWRRIDGKIESVSSTALRLRDDTGRTVAVDVSRLSTHVGSLLRPGDDVTIFAVGTDDNRLVAVGFVQAEPATGSALPRQ